MTCDAAVIYTSLPPSTPRPSSLPSLGPSRAKQLASLQASIRLIQAGRTVVGATGDLIQLRAPAAVASDERVHESEAKA